MKGLLILAVCLSYVMCQRYMYQCQQGQYWNGQRCLPCMSLGNGTAGYWECSSYLGMNNIVCNKGFYNYTNPITNVSSCEYGCDSYCNQCGLGPDAEVCYQCVQDFKDAQMIGSICLPIPTYNCVEYGANSGLCIECQSGYYLTRDPFEFNSTTSYQTQYGNYIGVNDQLMINNGMCAPCGISNCGQCDSANTCKLCMQGYYLTPSVNNQPTCTRCQDNNCIDCSQMRNNCTLCMAGYFVSAQNTCSQCTMTGCASCSNQTQCIQCNQGYYLNTTKSPQCQNCPQNCNQCSNSTYCTVCQPGFTASMGYCFQCSSIVGCQDCSLNMTTKPPTTVCNSCMDMWTLNKQSNTCSLCSTIANLTGALRCAGPNDKPSSPTLQPTQCSSSNVGSLPYFLTQKVSGGYACYQKEMDACEVMGEMQANSTAQCQQCFAGYQLIKGLCVPCQYPCQECAPNTQLTALVCLQCALGYYINGQGQCSSCSQNNNGLLNVCLTCPNNTCSFCYPGYYLNNKQCQQCKVPNCLECFDGNSTCRVCRDGYFGNFNPNQNVDQCVQCRQGCATCQSPGNVCDTCVDGYLKQGNGCVSFIQENCVAVDPFTGHCQFCDYGYYLNNGYCLKCVQTISGFVCRDNLKPPVVQIQKPQSSAASTQIILLLLLASVFISLIA